MNRQGLVFRRFSHTVIAHCSNLSAMAGRDCRCRGRPLNVYRADPTSITAVTDGAAVMGAVTYTWVTS